MGSGSLLPLSTLLGTGAEGNRYSVDTNTAGADMPCAERGLGKEVVNCRNAPVALAGSSFAFCLVAAYLEGFFLFPQVNPQGQLLGTAGME